MLLFQIFVVKFLFQYYSLTFFARVSLRKQFSLAKVRILLWISRYVESTFSCNHNDHHTMLLTSSLLNKTCKHSGLHKKEHINRLSITTQAALYSLCPLSHTQSHKPKFATDGCPAAKSILWDRLPSKIVSSCSKFTLVLVANYQVNLMNTVTGQNNPKTNTWPSCFVQNS